MLILFIHPSSLSAQEEEPDNTYAPYGLIFSKVDVELPKAGSFFNVLMVVNYTDESFTGRLSVSLPEGWSIIGQREVAVELAPGGVFRMPIRINVPPTVYGGVAYVVNAELRGEEYYDYTSCYVGIVPVSDWDMQVESQNVYLSEFRPQGEYTIRLSNRGNANEMIKLAFATGDLLEYVTPMENDSLLYVEMPAYSDTLLTFRIRERSGLSYAEQRSLINNWRSSSIFITASTPDRKKETAIRVLPLESSVLNDQNLRNTPLNIDVTLNNLLSYQIPKASAKVSGRLLFPDYQQLNYMVGVYNLYFNRERNQQFDLSRQLRYMVRYTDKNTSAEIGDRMGMGELHTLSGQGVRARHTINDQHTIYVNASNNMYSNNLGVYAGYSTTIRDIGLRTGFTLETNTQNSSGHYSFNLGSTFNFLRFHRVRIQTVTSLDRFSSGPYLVNDTSKVGFAYRLSYNYNGRRFKFRIDNTNTRLSYLRTSGINRINMRSVYQLNSVSRLEAIYYRNSYDATRYPYNFLYPSNKNITDNGQLLYTISRGNIVYYAGPQFTNSIRQYYNPVTTFTTLYRNAQPGLFGSVTFRLGHLRSISPYTRLNTMFVDFSSEDPDFIPYTLNGQFQYSVGLSYYDKAFKFNAYFSSGEASDIYRTVVVESDPSVNQSFHLRPYYERYFRRDAIRLSGYLNYSYYLPSMRENMIFNLTSDFFLKDGWRIFLSTNLYRVVRSDEEIGRIATRDLNILTGVRKSFDIQQPRLKFYDMVIVGFNDENGNGLKEPNEKPISNVMIKISRDNDKNLIQRTGFSEIALITDPNGEIFYERIPEGTYDLNITPLSSLESLYFLNGSNQTVEVNDDMIHYLPLVETYKVQGKVIVDRDPNSNEGKISLEGIRITASSADGETYSVLTDAFGSYMLSFPRATTYEVSIYNVFGERFVLEQGRYRVQFVANKTVNLDFKFTEKRRELRFNEGEQFFDFNIDRGNQ